MSMPKHKRAIALIPCYNSRKYIRTAVLGLLNQTRPLDLIVVLDDCSNDGFESEISDLVEKHDNLIIHRNPGNLGRSGCRNEGFERYDADYYFLNDADDVSLPERVEKTLVLMEANPNCGVCGGYVEYIDADDKFFGKGTQINCMTAEDAQRYRESLSPVGLFCSTACIRGEIIRKEGMRFDVSLPAAEDMDLWNRILEKGWDIQNVPEFLSQYRIHDESICTEKFVYCKHYSAFVCDALVRRRTGLPPIDFEQFCAAKRAEGLWKWLKFEYPIYAEFFYRTGGSHLVARRYIRGGIMLIISFLMQPRRIRRIICQRLGKKI